MHTDYHIIFPENRFADQAAERGIVRRRERVHAAVQLGAWLLLCYAASAFGALATRDASDFYNQLSLPWWAPSAGVFGPVWTVLYALMAVSAWMIWRGRHDSALDEINVMPALQLFGAQLAVNALWSWVFFAWNLGALSVVTILVLLALVVATTIKFYRINQTAGTLLFPYIAWLAFATCLAFSAWRRNPNLL
ncbi:MAG: tryptophan-rich sensory protein [Gemmatimonadaceae bacterium]|nr:tryptophan-rich sensory protein [Gemmatimonadaceae bacterium]